MPRIDVWEVCERCNGTGLYQGAGKRDGTAVQCSCCDGTGCYRFVHEYEQFARRREPVTPPIRVFELNPGVVIGNVLGARLEELGGLSYEDWVHGEPFPRGSELRLQTCPAWWLQNKKGGKKPGWSECSVPHGTAFRECWRFPIRAACWARFDREKL